MCFFDSTDKQLNTQIKQIQAIIMGGSLNAVNVIDEADPFLFCLGCQREITQIDVLFHNSLCWDCESSGKGLDNLSIYPYSLVSTVFNSYGVAVKIEAVQPVGLSVYNTAIYQEAMAFQAAHESDKSEPIGSLFEAVSEVGAVLVSGENEAGLRDIVLGDLVFRHDAPMMYYVNFRGIGLGLVFLHPNYDNWNFKLFVSCYKVSSGCKYSKILMGSLSQNWSQIVETFVHDNLEVLQKFRSKQSLKVVTCGCGRVGLVSSNKRKPFVCQSCAVA